MKKNLYIFLLMCLFGSALSLISSDGFSDGSSGGPICFRVSSRRQSFLNSELSFVTFLALKKARKVTKARRRAATESRRYANMKKEEDKEKEARRYLISSVKAAKRAVRARRKALR